MTALPANANHDGPRYYRGFADGTVLAEGTGGADAAPLEPLHDLRNHSSTGFAWGYSGSGPSQLALALLADSLGDDDLALEFYQRFKDRFVARLPGGEAWGPVAVEEIRMVLAEMIAAKA